MARPDDGHKKRRALVFPAWLFPIAIPALALLALPARAQHGPMEGTTTEPPNRPTENFSPPPVPTFPATAPCEVDSETVNGLDSSGSAELKIFCSLTLRANATITRTLVYEGRAASGATLNCTCDQSGCTSLKGDILITSPSGKGRPENITIRNCKILGAVKLNDPSFTFCTGDLPQGLCRDQVDGFEKWVQDRAPRRITFDTVTIDGVGGNRFYVGWGVTETKLINSLIKGHSSGAPIYLAPSSSKTLLKNNRISTYTAGSGPDYYAGRESISIDGSDHNRIISNWFGALSRGGIYVYRNCGENGGIRKTTPSHNHIVNNVFYYDHYNGSSPAVFLGSRNGNAPGITWPWECYCGCDDKRKSVYGSTTDSSVDDRDFATHNIVMQNEVVQHSVTALNQSLNWENNAMNLVDRNQRVSEGKWPRPAAGCYVRGGEKEFIVHGETTERFMGVDGSPTCDKVTCHDGELRPAHPQHYVVPPSSVAASSTGPAATTIAPASSTLSTGESGASFCRTRRVPIDCRVNGDNDGCKGTVLCPAGTKIVGAVAACNLEDGAVTDAELATVPPNLIHVAKLPDHVPSGSCNVEGNVIRQLVPSVPLQSFVPQSAVQIPIRNIAGRTRVEVGCKEFDENGGDCHIRGSLYCR